MNEKILSKKESVTEYKDTIKLVRDVFKKIREMEKKERRFVVVDGLTIADDFLKILNSVAKKKKKDISDVLDEILSKVLSKKLGGRLWLFCMRGR